MSSTWLISEPCWNSCDAFHSDSIAASSSQNSLAKTARHCKHTQRHMHTEREVGEEEREREREQTNQPMRKNQDNKYKNLTPNSS